MSFGLWSQTREPVFLFLFVFFWLILVKSFVRHGLVFQGVAAGLLLPFLTPAAFPSSDVILGLPPPSFRFCWFFLSDCDIDSPSLSPEGLLLLLLFFYSEINCFFVCVWGVRTIIPSLDALFLPPWFEILLKKLLHHPWNLSKYELFLLFAFFYSLWILMRRFHSFSRCLYFVSLFRCFFFPFFLSFLQRILAMSSCCCCDFWDCLGGVGNLLSSVPFRCRIFLLRNFFWFCASITSLRFFLFCFCPVFCFRFFSFSYSFRILTSSICTTGLCFSYKPPLFFFFFSLSFSLFLLLF